MQLLFKNRITYATQELSEKNFVTSFTSFSTMYNNYPFVNEINELP